MPVHHVEGNLFDHDGAKKVVTCNTKGAMGAGIALECKRRYPDVYQRYHQHCRWGHYQAGGFYVSGANPEIWLVMTKDDWRDPSRIEWVDSILLSFKHYAEGTYLSSGTALNVAMPLLGAGHGGLDGRLVLDHTHRYLDSSAANFYLYLPR